MSVIIIRHKDSDILLVSASVEGAVIFLSAGDYTFDDGAEIRPGLFSERFQLGGSVSISGPDGEEIVAEVHPVEF